MGVFIEGKTYQLAPEGNHRAVCIGVYDLGTHDGGQYGPKRKIRIVWELVDEEMGDGRPFIVGRDFTMSLGDRSRLKPILESWRGRAFTPEELKRFDVANLLGKSCLVNVVHQKPADRVYANVNTVSQLPKGMSKAEPRNPLIQFSIDECDGEFPEGLPDWIKDKVRESPEWQSLYERPATPVRPSPAAEVILQAEEEDEDIPF